MKKAKKYLNVFISYSRSTGAKYLYKCISLLKECCHAAPTPLEIRIVFDDRFLKADEDFWEVAQKFYSAADIAVLIVTPEIKHSNSISKELDYLKMYNTAVLPILFDGDLNCLPQAVASSKAVVYTSEEDTVLQKTIIDIMESHATKTLNPDMAAIQADNEQNGFQDGFSTLLINAARKGAEDGIAIIIKAVTVCAICTVAICLISLLFGKSINWQELWDKIIGLL